MASILKVGSTWRAQVRRRGHKSISETFATKAQALVWARKIEAQMDARTFSDARGLANLTLKELIDWHCEAIGSARLFGKNKTSVLNMWRREHGDVKLSDLTTSYLTRSGVAAMGTGINSAAPCSQRHQAWATNAEACALEASIVVASACPGCMTGGATRSSSPDADIGGAQTSNQKPYQNIGKKNT